MNSIVWVCAGAAIGWIAYAFLELNTDRGVVVSILIGGVAAFFGGHILAPALGEGLSSSSDLSVITLFFAIGSAIAFLKIADFMYERWGA